MNLLPDAIAWLEKSVKSKSPSSVKVWAQTILTELNRLHETLDTCSHDLDKALEFLAQEGVERRKLEAAFEKLEETARRERQAWDAARVELESRLTAAMKGEA